MRRRKMSTSFRSFSSAMVSAEINLKVGVGTELVSIREDLNSPLGLGDRLLLLPGFMLQYP